MYLNKTILFVLMDHIIFIIYLSKNIILFDYLLYKNKLIRKYFIYIKFHYISWYNSKLMNEDCFLKANVCLYM